MNDCGLWVTQAKVEVTKGMWCGLKGVNRCFVFFSVNNKDSSGKEASVI